MLVPCGCTIQTNMDPLLKTLLLQVLWSKPPQDILTCTLKNLLESIYSMHVNYLLFQGFKCLFILFLMDQLWGLSFNNHTFQKAV